MNEKKEWYTETHCLMFVFVVFFFCIISSYLGNRLWQLNNQVIFLSYIKRLWNINRHILAIRNKKYFYNPRRFVCFEFSLLWVLKNSCNHWVIGLHRNGKEGIFQNTKASISIWIAIRLKWCSFNFLIYSFNQKKETQPKWQT